MTVTTVLHCVHVQIIYGTTYTYFKYLILKYTDTVQLGIGPRAFCLFIRPLSSSTEFLHTNVKNII